MRSPGPNFEAQPAQRTLSVSRGFFLFVAISPPLLILLEEGLLRYFSTLRLEKAKGISPFGKGPYLAFCFLLLVTSLDMLK